MLLTLLLPLYSSIYTHTHYIIQYCSILTNRADSMYIFFNFNGPTLPWTLPALAIYSEYTYSALYDIYSALYNIYTVLTLCISLAASKRCPALRYSSIASSTLCVLNSSVTVALSLAVMSCKPYSFDILIALSHCINILHHDDIITTPTHLI